MAEIKTITVGGTQYDINDPRLILGSDTTKFLCNDGTWQVPPGETYNDATTSVHGLMSASDKQAVNKIGTGSLNTTNSTLIPAVNELKALLGSGSLNTSAQNVIAAINELKSNVDNGLNPRTTNYVVRTSSTNSAAPSGTTSVPFSGMLEGTAPSLVKGQWTLYRRASSNAESVMSIAASSSFRVAVYEGYKYWLSNSNASGDATATCVLTEANVV